MNKNKSHPYYDIIIVGGGVVGCAVLRAATLQGWKCVLVESEEHLLSHASGSNSGIVCTGVDASPGTLERALIRESNSLFRIYCRKHNIPIQPVGSIVCSWPWDRQGNHSNNNRHQDKDNNGRIGEEKKKEDDHNTYNGNRDKVIFDGVTLMQKKEQNICDNLAKVFNESLDANDTHIRRLSSAQIQTLEPNLSSRVLGGVHIPGEIVVDPWLYSISLAIHAQENGAHIFTNSRFDSMESSFDSGNEVWNIVVTNTKTGDEDDGSKKKRLQAKVVINAAGLWSDLIQKQTLNQKQEEDNKPGTEITEKRSHSSVKTWKAKPRRGQYRIYRSNNTTSIIHPIQPVPTQRTKGIFVFSSYYNHIVVGPTALDQESRTDRSIDPKVDQELDKHVRRIIPNINTEKDCIGGYVGIRPGTDKRDYQIHLLPRKNWIAVGGIRSTGLTASLGIGNYVVRLLHIILDDCTVRDNDSSLISTTPLPPLPLLIRDFQRRNDGFVNIHGNIYKVTHPLTSCGWSGEHL